VTGEPHADSIEIELTPADLAPRQPTGEVQSTNNAAPHSNVQRRIIRSSGALAIMFGFVMLRSFAEYGGVVAVQRQVADTSAASAPQLVPQKPQQLGASLRMANPFDSSEVFEFPPGTSRAEAREWVANLLLQRARDRRPQWGALKHKARQQISGDTSAG
jgi:hypothetical protein